MLFLNTCLVTLLIQNIRRRKHIYIYKEDTLQYVFNFNCYISEASNHITKENLIVDVNVVFISLYLRTV